MRPIAVRPLVAGCIATGLLTAIGVLACLPGARGQTADTQSGTEVSGFPATVRDFGAAGDGVADDTAAIQRAVDAQTGDIVFPRGTYRLTRTVVIDLDRVGWTALVGFGTARVVMEGAGPAFRFVGTHTGTAAPATVKENVWDRQRMPTVDGLEILGAHAEACGIEAYRTMQLTITRCHIRDCLHAIHLVERNRNVTLGHCHLYRNRGVGVYMEDLNLHQIDVANCHISYCAQGGIVVRNSEIRNLQIGTCDIEGNMVEGGEPTANVLLDCRTGSVREGAIVGCTIQHTHNSAGSANIRFIGQSREVALKVGNFVISDNALSDVAVNIHLENARGVTITGNTFWSGFEHDLLVEGSSRIVVGPNLLDRNPDYRGEDGNHGIVFRECQDCVLQGILLQGVRRKESGLLLDQCSGFNITGSTFTDCDGCSVLLRQVTGSRLSDCIIRAADAAGTASLALKVEGGGDNQIVDNLIRGAVEGIERTQ